MRTTVNCLRLLHLSDGLAVSDVLAAAVLAAAALLLRMQYVCIFKWHQQLKETRTHSSMSPGLLCKCGVQLRRSWKLSHSWQTTQH